jgi:hypothetical protein
MSHVFDDDLAHRVRTRLMALLDRDYGAATVCPCDAARVMAPEFRTPWRDLMRVVRCVATQLADIGSIEILQQGRPIDIREARGPILLRLKNSAGVRHVGAAASRVH